MVVYLEFSLDMQIWKDAPTLRRSEPRIPYPEPASATRLYANGVVRC